MTRRAHPRTRRYWRRLRRWARHTPNGIIAANMITAGVGLILLSVMLEAVLL